MIERIGDGVMFVNNDTNTRVTFEYRPSARSDHTHTALVRKKAIMSPCMKMDPIVENEIIQGMCRVVIMAFYTIDVTIILT